MGTFATTTSLQTLIPGVTFDAATTSLCTMCITWAESFIRGKLSRRYNMSASPFNTSTSIPPQITAIAERMAMGYYFRNSSRGSKESLARANELLKDAQAEVMDIASWKSDLVDTTFASVSERSTGIHESFSSYHTTFDEDDPVDWSVDDDKLSAISDGRD